MSYRLATFDGATIPGDAGEHDIGPGEVRSTLVETPGGLLYDPLGTEFARSQARSVRARGTLSAANSSGLKTALDTWLAKRGKRATLTRVDDGGSSTHSVTARLVSVRAPRSYGHPLTLPIELTFDILSLPWAGAAHNQSFTLDSSAKEIVVNNAGNARVTNAILTFTARGSNVTNLNISVAGVSNFTYSGTVAQNQSLVIDCGALTCVNNSTGDYANFALSPTLHLCDDWLRLESSNNTLTITTSGGTNSTMQVAMFDGWG